MVEEKEKVVAGELVVGERQQDGRIEVVGGGE